MLVSLSLTKNIKMTKKRFVCGILILLFLGLAYPGVSGLGFRMTMKEIKGNGVSATREEFFSAFRAIDLAAPVRVKVMSGERFSCTLTGDENLLAYIEVSMDGETLRFRKKDRNVRMPFVSAVVTTPESIRSVKMSGSSSAKIEVPADSQMLNVSVSGSGNVVFTDVRAEKIDIGISGSGSFLAGNVWSRNIDCGISGSGSIAVGRLEVRESSFVSVSGSGRVAVEDLAAEDAGVRISGSGRVVFDRAKFAGRFNAEVRGSGNVAVLAGSVPSLHIDGAGCGIFNLGSLEAETVTCNLSGTAAVDVWAAKSLAIEASGAGSVVYGGKPAQVDVQASGAVRIEKR